jgi:superfamily II DNA/RNA helicase
MLDMGFIPDIEEICTKLPKVRQTLLFSATMPPPIKKLADRFLTDPKTIEVARPATANINIAQRIVQVPATAHVKRDVLRRLLQQDEVSNAIIFCNRKTTVRDLNKSLKKHGFRSAEIHGDMDQSARIAELDRFKNGDVNILVASDVAARGIDVKGVSHVFNFDAPWHPDDYVHRIGRTGRGGATGIAYTLVTPEDAENIVEIEKLTGHKIERVPSPVAVDGADDAPAPKRTRGSKRDTKKAEPRREEVAAEAPAKPKSRRVAATGEEAPEAAAPREESRARPQREERPARDERPVRDERPAREERPARAERPVRDERPIRDERPARDDRRRRRDQDDGPDDGWNGPIPDFLNYTIDA